MQGLMSKFKCNGGATNPADDKDTNVILQLYDIGPQVATAGHGLVWRIHDGVRKSDSKQVSIFMFDKRIADKLYRPKRKESVLERMRDSVHQVERWRHPKFLTIVHPLEESQQTLAFASEPLIASLHNILTYQESAPLPVGSPPLVFPEPLSLNSAPPPPYSPPERPQFANNYEFCDIELAYGILQLIDALHFMHYTARRVHRNICPQIVLITKRGTWKMFGLEFAEEVHGRDPQDPVPIPPYSMKIARIGQPLLDYMGKPLLDYTAPECQTNAHCTILSDVYSLGLLICAIFNRGKTVIQANNNPILYMKQVENLELAIDGLMRITSRSLREALERMLNKDPSGRPTTQLLPLINYFRYGPIDTKEEEEAQQKKVGSGQPEQRNRGPEVIVALQLLDTIQYRDFEIKNHYYRNTLYDALCKIPRKLLWMTVWPYLAGELRAQELAPNVFMPVIWFINMATPEEFEKIIFPSIRACFRKFVNDPAMIKYSYVVLENLHQVLEKCNIDEINVDILPLLYKALEDPSYQMQLSALICLQTSTEYIMDRAMQYRVTPKIKQIIERSPSNVELINLSLGVYELTTKQLDRTQVNESVIPALLAIKFRDPEIIHRTFKLLKDFIDDPRFGISTTTMATKLIPTLTPLTLNNSLNLEQFSAVMELLYQMLDFIDQQQRIMITRPPPPSPTPERRKLRHQMSTDNVAPPFNIPNLRVEKRKTSSAEDMLRKHSIVHQSREQTTNEATDNTVAGNFKKMVSGSGFAWIFGSSNSNAGPSTSNDSNFLRVTNVFTNRRLSDNTLITPKIRVAPSCASSPGGTPGGSNSALPARRHSSIGPQERRGSNVNLSPPTAVHHHRGRAGGSGSSLSVPSTSHVGGSMPNTSSSVPQLLTSSMQSIRSRRSSAGPSQGSQGSQGILQQIHSGVVRHLPATPNRSPKTNPSQWSTIQGATSAGYNAIRQTASTAVRKCPSLNISIAN